MQAQVCGDPCLCRLINEYNKYGYDQKKAAFSTQNIPVFLESDPELHTTRKKGFDSADKTILLKPSILRLPAPKN